MICPRCGRTTADSTGACACDVLPATMAGGSVAALATIDPATLLASHTAVTHAGTALTVDLGAPPAADLARLNEGPLRDGQAFGNRYRIIRLLGIGGMGAVYQAWDEELSVALALKVIRVSRAVGAADLEKRFKHELLLARQVTHKHVVRIHDLGEMDGIKYITMPYIKGEDLARLLAFEGRLAIPRALRLARHIADGLAAAHEAGVVHRDLKPANVMVSRTGDQEQALIMDFGISASVTDVHTGEVSGTLEYMAPEQAAGDAVDARADVYAFGLILYEMLSGIRTHPGVTFEQRREAMWRRFGDGIVPVQTLVPAIPASLAAVVDRCLQREPAARFQSATEIDKALALLDDTGEPLPLPSRFSPAMIAASLCGVLLAVTATWWLVRTPPPPPKHDPVSVLVADIQNSTGDTSFDHALEPTIKMALEGASFVSAFDRTQFRSLGVAPPPKLDEAAAREVALKQGLGVIVSGTIRQDRSGYVVSLKGQQAVTGAVVGTADARAARRDDVLAAASKTATALRTALGDTSADASRRFATETLSSTSLDVVHEYVLAMEAVSNSRFDEARMRFSKAVELDPNFGLAYAGMAMMSWNLRQQHDAEQSIKEAVRHVDRMTDRERYRTRGLFYMITGDDQACIKEYSDLLSRYAADSTAHNNLALCASHVHDWTRALDEMRQVVQLLPRRALYRVNLGLYAAYGGDFDTAAREGGVARDLGSPLGWLPIAFAATGQGHVDDARTAYGEFGKSGPGATYQSAGLADLASYEGRYTDAARLYRAAAASHLETGLNDRAAASFAGLAYVELSRGQQRAAAAAAERALSLAVSLKARFQAARLLIEAGAPDSARAVVATLSASLLPEAQTYAKILNGDIALNAGDLQLAVKTLTDANATLDTWIGHFDLGRAYLKAGAFIQADSEVDRCLKRRGEALALFLDEEPTFAYLPAVFYLQGQVRDGLQSAGASESYLAYQSIRGAAGQDPLLADVNRRVSR